MAELTTAGPRAHFRRNVLAHARKSGRRVISAFIATACAQETPEAASTQWRAVADQIRPKVPTLAANMDGGESDVLAYITFPSEHRSKLHKANPTERLNGEIKRRTELSASSPTMTPSSDLVTQFCSNRRTSGPCNATAT